MVGFWGGRGSENPAPRARASTFPIMMARRLAGAGGDLASQSDQRRKRPACQDRPRAEPRVGTPVVAPLDDLNHGEFPKLLSSLGGFKNDGRSRWW